ncbi:hypothetical protein GCM10023176_61600 [Micromonospora coerulea]|uniref:Uncharacterized protein n=1 Tax=Micromonospora coerulea TaxID=47856 RepID=A0ABP8T6A0_9ACTN
MAALRNAAISALRLTGVTNIAAANRHHARDSNRPVALLGITLGLCRGPAVSCTPRPLGRGAELTAGRWLRPDVLPVMINSYAGLDVAGVAAAAARFHP